MPIYFYSTHDEFGGFSNFSRHPIRLDGKTWPTSEHYFQAMKFEGTPHVGEVLRAKTPAEAKEMGRDRKRPLRKDWESVKDDVMRKVVLAKFRAYTDLRAELLGTGDEEIIENAPTDSYWGCGADGKGKNMLGRILMEVRAILRAEIERANAKGG